MLYRDGHAGEKKLILGSIRGYERRERQELLHHDVHRAGVEEDVAGRT